MYLHFQHPPIPASRFSTEIILVEIVYDFGWIRAPDWPRHFCEAASLPEFKNDRGSVYVIVR